MFKRIERAIGRCEGGNVPRPKMGVQGIPEEGFSMSNGPQSSKNGRGGPIAKKAKMVKSGFQCGVKEYSRQSLRGGGEVERRRGGTRVNIRAYHNT